jgi:putative flippase GtrA
MSFLHDFYFKLHRFFSARFPRLAGVCGRQNSLIKYALAGSVTTVFDLIFLFIFHGLLKMEIVGATTLAFIISFLIGFMLHKFWTFRNHDRAATTNQLFLYFLNIIFVLYLNGVFMHLLVVRFFIWYLAAQIVVNIIIGLWSWLIYKFLIFKNNLNEVYRH